VKTSPRRVRALAMIASALGVAAPASASTGRVALVRQTQADPTMAEAIHRIRGELVADGFDVLDVEAAPELESSTPSGAALEPAALATIDLSADSGAHIAELRVVDQVTKKMVIRRTWVDDSQTPHAAEVLAVRAVELLRASLLELLLEADRSAPGPPSVELRQVSQWAARGPPVRPESGWGVEVGACVLADFGGIPPAVLGLARVRRTLVGPLSVRVTVAGLGTQARVEAVAGSALVTQDVGLAELVVMPWPAGMLRPVLSLGAGAFYASVDGRANPPYAGRQSARWAGAVDGGVGAEARIGGRFALSLEAHALLVQPFPVVEVLGADVARGGQPSVLTSLSVVGWL
jgi:hypothetical protein